jgi:tetratricopeptide (TPR) repeat protein
VQILIPNLTLFFDTSFISEAHFEDIKLALEQLAEVKYITDGVYRELWEGYLHNQCDERFSLIFDPLSENRLRNNFKTISLAKCMKEEAPIDFNQDNVFLKKSSLLCSGYYAWLHCCVNPSMITDPIRHYYNAALHMIHTKGDPNSKVIAFIGGLREQEIGSLERIGFKKEGFTASALKRAWKKRAKDTKKNTFKITDYELVLTAFLYFCFSRNNVMVFTCDNDLIDIKDNLIRSAIEKYTLNQILTKKLRTTYKYRYINEGNIIILLSGKEIRNELKNTFEAIRNDKLSMGFQIAFYDRRDRKIYGGVVHIPVWLMDFVLEYRLNINCYSVDKRLEKKYPLNYIMNPREGLEEIYFNITLRKERQYYGLMPDCEDICNYARKEKETPSDLSSFVELSDFYNPNKPDFSNPWVKRGFILFRDGCYDEALKAFDKAIDLEQECVDAWYGKGISLGELDRHEEAVSAFENVIKLNSNHHDAFCSWGGMLLGLAALRQRADREALLEGAAEKFAKAIEIKPDMPEALYGWGNALSKLVAFREETCKKLLLEEAIEKFDMAAQVRPDMPEAFFSCGIALSYLAASHEGSDREALLRQATEKFARTVEIKPDMAEAFYQWGNALGGLATLPEARDREVLLREAIEKFATALEIKPEMDEALFHWGHALRDLAALSEESGREALLREAAEKYGKTSEIRPDMPEALSDWGYALLVLADFHEGLEQELLLKEAVEKYAKALEIKPDRCEDLYNWATALLKLADLQEGIGREVSLKQAVEKYIKVIEIDPDNYYALYNLCDVLRMLSYIYKGKQRIETLEAALEKAKRVEDLQPGAGNYSMASIYALLGQKENALTSLSKAIEIDQQYRRMAVGNEDFRSLWEGKDFKNIVTAK